MNKTRFTLLAGMILAAAASRLIPHPPNFTPIAALALFGGASLADKRAAFLAPLAGLFLSDLVLGFYALLNVTSPPYHFSETRSRAIYFIPPFFSAASRWRKNAGRFSPPPRPQPLDL